MFDAPQPANSATAIIAVPRTFNLSGEHQLKITGTAIKKTVTPPGQAATVPPVGTISK
jgi:hypothetical protein